MSLATIRKALIAAVGAGVAAAVTAYPDGFTSAEIGIIVGAAVAAGWATWRVPNADILQPGRLPKP